MSLDKAIENWYGLVLPKPGSYSSNYHCMAPLALHMLGRLKATGSTLVEDSAMGTRCSLGTGHHVVEELLALDGQGFLQYSDARDKVLLFEHGAINLNMGRPEERYARPVMTERVLTHLHWAGTQQFVDEVSGWMNARTEPASVTGSVYAMVSGHGGISFNSIGSGGEPLTRENYSSGVLASYDRIKETLRAKNPPGRINIMSGPPGTGKTYLIRGLIQEVVGVKFAIVQASTVQSLADPGILPALLNFRTENQPIVFIIEDAEECLAHRDAGNNSAVSTLLNMGDGVLGGLIDVRIIATTNTKVADLDAAIRRPGRLSTICEVGPLKLIEADKVYHRLTGKDFQGENEFYTIAEIYQMATDAGWRGDIKPKKKVGFQTEDTEDYMDRLEEIMK